MKNNCLKKYPIALIILDGFGYSDKVDHNAIAQARPDNLESWLLHYPNTILKASGQSVGLLEGMIGNSQVGHLTIGAGRVVQQPITVLINQINTGEFYKNPELIKLFKEFAQKNNSLHLLGLLSDAGVHSHEIILYALIKMAHDNGINNIIVHAFLDGRDTPPQSAGKYLDNIDKVFKEVGVGKLGSIHGRFYAMDRDKNWERTERSYKTLVDKDKSDNNFNNWREALDYYYSQNISDEFIPPTKLINHCEIKSDDALIFFNMRADRSRQLTQSLIDPNFNEFEAEKLNFNFVITGINYKDQFKAINLVKKNIVKETLFDVLEKNNISIFSIAETEKYAHITYFFNGGQEKARECETRILIPSIPKKQYINLPQMSADKITATVLNSLEHDQQDFYLINYANADMVGHSGNFDATVKAIKILDGELGKLYQKIVIELGGTMYITGDHGNAESMKNLELNQPYTSHTTNPVYFLILNKNLQDKKLSLNLHELSDISPFILTEMGLKAPDAMKKI